MQKTCYFLVTRRKTKTGQTGINSYIYNLFIDSCINKEFVLLIVEICSPFH